jgi:hypothetical protein
MKKLLLTILLSCFTSIFAQQFSNLKGLEDHQGNTILLYSFGNDVYGNYSPIYKYNPSTNQETKIIDAYSYQIDSLHFNGKSVSDYEFFQNDQNNFINVGMTEVIDILGYAARNDSITFTQSFLATVDISKQNLNLIYLSDFSNIYRSFDGGYSYPVDSTIEFRLVSVSEYNDKTFFGVDDEGNLIKSENRGISSMIVDTSKVITALPFLSFYYDQNQDIVYRKNISYGRYAFYFSNNEGNAFSWDQRYESENPFYIAIDSTHSGLIYLADGKQILKSTTAGVNFEPYKSLPNKIVGIYKKPNSDIIYAASKYQIYEVRPDTLIVLKSVPLPSYIFEYYPLEIGNKWIFNFASISYWPFPIYTYDTFSRTVVDFVIKENNKSYYKIDEKFLSDSYINTYYERIDSSSGLILRFNPECPDSEQVIDDLNGEVGDALSVNRFESCQNYVQTVFENVEEYNEFGINSYKRKYNYNGLLFVDYTLVSGVGLEHILTGYDFGTDVYDMKGFIIDGIIYGDTTLTDIDDNTLALPTEFILSQNYPNPFNPITKISWQSPVSSHQTLKVYDVLGNEVATLVNEYRNAGSSEVDFNASKLSNGIYFYRLTAGSFVQTKKMILIK